ncbi:MAG: metal-dependent hydrolase [Tenacibaculum sp.]
MKITYYGHSCFGFKIDNTYLLIDPFITGNPKASKINLAKIKADYILITHAHQDHVLDVEVLAKTTGAIVVSNYEIAMYYGAKKLKVHPLNHGGSYKSENFTAKYVNAIHTSSFADGTYGGQPGGFVISGLNKSVYIAGDTALTIDMQLIPMSTELTASILPIGGSFTMGVEDAITASNFIKCNRIIGCHYNTFPAIEVNTEQAKKQFADKQKELLLLKIEETITL